MNLPDAQVPCTVNGPQRAGAASANENLPGFVVIISKDRIDQPLYSRLWGNGFPPRIHQGVPFRGGDPVLYLQNPDGVSPLVRRSFLDRLAELSALQATILHQLGINHEQLTYKHQGRYYRLTDVSGEVVKDVLV